MYIYIYISFFVFVCFIFQTISKKLIYFAYLWCHSYKLKWFWNALYYYIMIVSLIYYLHLKLKILNSNFKNYILIFKFVLIEFSFKTCPEHILCKNRWRNENLIICWRCLEQLHESCFFTFKYCGSWIDKRKMFI